MSHMLRGAKKRPTEHKSNSAEARRLALIAAFLSALVLDIAMAQEDEGQVPGKPRQEGPNPPITVKLRGNLLSVRLRNAAWETVLMELQRQTGIVIETNGKLSGATTAEFENRPLEEAIESLFRDFNRVSFYAEGPAGEAFRGRLTLWCWPLSYPSLWERRSMPWTCGSLPVPMQQWAPPRGRASLTLVESTERVFIYTWPIPPPAVPLTEHRKLLPLTGGRHLRSSFKPLKRGVFGQPTLPLAGTPAAQHLRLIPSMPVVRIRQEQLPRTL